MEYDIRSPELASIHAFWNDQAKRFGAGVAAVSHDPILKDLEIAALIRHLGDHLDTLEVGTGNGVNLRRLSATFTGRLVGIDYSEEMIRVARQMVAEVRPGSDMMFVQEDVLGRLSRIGRFPQVFTCRCLINLPTRELQRQALHNLAEAVLPGGRLILIEGVRQGQDRINELRGLVDLPPILFHWHNLYLDEDRLLDELPSGLEHVTTDNFASLYWLASRVFNARLTPSGQQPDYLAEINKIAARLPSIGDCGAIKLFAFRKSAESEQNTRV